MLNLVGCGASPIAADGRFHEKCVLDGVLKRFTSDIALSANDGRKRVYVKMFFGCRSKPRRMEYFKGGGRRAVSQQLFLGCRSKRL